MSIRDASCIAPVLGPQGMPKGPSKHPPTLSPSKKHALTNTNLLFLLFRTVFTGRHLWPEIPSVIGYRNAADHSRRRRPWNRAFSSASVRDAFMPVIQHRVHLLGEALAAREGQVLDLTEWMSYFT